MFKKIKTSFKTQLIFTMVGILFIPILLGCIFTYRYFAEKHREQTATKLQWLALTKARSLQEYLEAQSAFLQLLSTDKTIQQIFLQYQNSASGKLLSSQFKSLIVNKFILNPDWEALNLSFINAGNGVIFYQNIAQPDLGKSILEPPVANTALQHVVQEAIQSKSVSFSDLERYAPINGSVLFIAAPVLNLRGSVLGVMVVQISEKTLNALFQDPLLKRSDLEVYLINQTGHLLSYAGTKTPEGSIKFNQFSDFNTCQEIIDFANQKSFAFAQPIGFDAKIKTKAKWYVVAQIKYHQYTAPLTNLIIFFIILSSFLLLIGGLVAYWIGHRITIPIKKVTTGLHEVTKGNLAVNVETIKEEHEIGILTRSLKSLTENLKEQIKDLSENINIIASSSSEVSATVAQITAASSETATAITETASSSEEVSQLASTFNEKAKESLKVGEQAAQITNQGTEAFNKINQGIKEVKSQMDQVANMVLDLSKQSQTIGEITEAVKEIAEQSNILAINASIEATKAGEYGKGFAVVANEVRNLADQSKKSTLQIRDILDSIQEAISKTVMQVEETNKTIDHSVDFVQKAYDSMNQLAHSIESLISVLTEISQFSQEQLIGTSQIKEAMENIKEATSQNLDGMHQLEDVIDDLKQTSENLKALISMYKLN